LGITRAEAMLQVLTGECASKQAETKLVLFSPKGIEGGPAYLQGFGWVGPETVERLHEGATVIDADEVAHAETASYQPTDAIRTFVEGRDGTCRWPRSEEHTSELQSRFDLVCRLLLEKKKQHFY